MQRILFVCLGNICRSPAAEAVLRHSARHLGVDSAGTAGYHIGAAPYGPMQQAARARGYDLSALRARQFSVDDFEAFDLIVAMDGANLADIEALRPDRDDTPVRLFTDYADKDGSPVPDPYYTRDFDGCLDLIERCAQGLAKTL